MADRQPGTTADYHAYLQFAMDEQLAEVAGVAGDSGLELGLYVDLAVGAAQDGADAAAFPGLFVRGATIGAPPDAYAEGGQDWSLHPLHPIRLRDSGYRYWRQMLGAAMRHAGAVRIDHVMGVERQFWIPDGCTARDGAYVQYPAAELFGVLALESERHRAVVVGESLGTLPDGFLERLHGWGILSSQVLYFEREADGSFKASDDYSSQAMVTLNTHDLATWTGFWTGRDLDQRRETGVISEARWERLRVEREGERARLAERIGAAELAGNGPGEDTAAALCPVVHEFLGRTPAPLVGVALGDLAGEATGVNVPGAPLDRYAAWTRRQRQSLDAIRNSHLAQETLTAVRGTGRGRSEPEG